MADPAWVVSDSDRAVVTVLPGTLRDRQNPLVTGFHLIWWNVQNDIWSAENDAPFPEAKQLLQSLAGTIYRYGGNANEGDWRNAIGPVSQRRPEMVAAREQRITNRFGTDEYFSFLRLLGSKHSMFIANLAGYEHRELSITEMAARNAQWAGYVRSAAPDMERVWELGNELDRGEYRWPPEKFALRAAATAEAIHAADPGARLILPLMDHNVRGQISPRDFNRQIIRKMPAYVQDFSLHLYYDGPPGGPPIPHRIQAVIDAIDDFRAVRGATQTPHLWITEHARWPGGKSDNRDWQQLWHKTSNLGGAIGTADFLTALSQVPETRVAIWHALRGGPWNLLEVKHDSSGKPASITPTPVYWMHRVLQHGQLEETLVTHTASPNVSDYAGGYNVRASAFRTADGNQFALWVVNRARRTLPVTVHYAPIAATKLYAQHFYVAAEDGRNPDENNANLKIQLAPPTKTVTADSTGELIFNVPASSVSAIVMARKPPEQAGRKNIPTLANTMPGGS
jgi:hypothetical protein